MLAELDMPREPDMPDMPDMLASDMPAQAESRATTAAAMMILNIVKIAWMAA